MTRGSSSRLEPQEIVEYLKNSSMPSLLVEGKDDMQFFQKLEELCFDKPIDYLPAGSRDQLFEVFKRRLEFSHVPVAFLADSDFFIFQGVPQGLEEIIFTDGYSLENDILSGGMAFNLIERKHCDKWERLLSLLSVWFESIVHRRLSGEGIEFAYHPAQVVDFQTEVHTALGKSALVPPENLMPVSRLVTQTPIKYLRGHTLHNGLGHFLALVGNDPKCSKEMLLYTDIVAWKANPQLQRLINLVKGRIYPP